MYKYATFPSFFRPLFVSILRNLLVWFHIITIICVLYLFIDQIHEFGSKWNYHQLPPGDTPGQAPPADYQLDPDTRTIFERLFGRKFPGFSGRDC